MTTDEWEKQKYVRFMSFWVSDIFYLKSFRTKEMTLEPKK